MSDWISHPENIVFLILAVVMVGAGFRSVTSRNVVHSVLFLVVALASSAALFLLLGAEFVAWTVVLVYIGAVIVLFLFGIMITRAPLGTETQLSHSNQTKVGAAIVSGALFALITVATLQGFGDTEFVASPTRTEDVGLSIFQRFVIPFEVVSVVLLAALIGGIVLARRDPVSSDDLATPEVTGVATTPSTNVAALADRPAQGGGA
ncbi:MAG: NADH-quinone oxidoreductase subunit J [Acidimicrobiia bacterium]|nr:NADH-quinone oxidoreductase subunit J [Acidimicrobiia bacterium]